VKKRTEGTSRDKTKRPKVKLTSKLRRIRRSNNGVIRVPDGEAEQGWLFNFFVTIILLLIITLIIFFISGGEILTLFRLIRA